MEQQIHSQSGERATVEQLKEKARQAGSLELMSKEETMRMRAQHVGPSCALFFPDDPLKIVRGDGQYLYDERGAEYLDCINNVAHIGHANRRVQEAVSRQLSLLNTNSRFLHDNLSLYARRLTASFPAHLSVCYLVNSGSEANDLAMRLARAYTGRTDVVSLDGAYHGNLSSTMAISPYKLHHMSASERVEWAHVADLPCQYRGRYTRDQFAATATVGAHSQSSQSAEQLADDTIGRLYADGARELIQTLRERRGRQVAAMFVESMVSCGGQTPLPPGYLRHLSRQLRELGTLLVCDEVQTGFGRSGKCMWAFQLDGDQVEPDIVTLGKPMGNGFPVAAVVTRPEIARAFKQIGTEYFNTFGGNPVSCAAALAVLDELEERRLMAHAGELGDFMLGQLRDLQARFPRFLGDVRGQGLFIGLELVEDPDSKRPAPHYASFIVRHFRRHQIIMSTEGKLGNVLKFKPPMCFTRRDGQRFIQVLAGALEELQLEVQEQQRAGCKSSISSASSSASSSWMESSGELEDR